MAVRSGQEFIDGLRRAPREVWAAGRKVTDVTADPMFARPVRSIAELYDLQVAPAGLGLRCLDVGQAFGVFDGQVAVQSHGSHALASSPESYAICLPIQLSSPTIVDMPEGFLSARPLTGNVAQER